MSESKSFWAVFAVVSKTIREGRCHVTLTTESGTSATMPNAHYAWLLANPVFNEIPKGYSIHRLDFDPLNDDPTNLVLMKSTLHGAYHFKHSAKNSTPPTRAFIQDASLPSLGSNIARITVSFNKQRNRWGLTWMEGERGKKKQRKLYAFNGKPFESKEDAEECRVYILNYLGISVSVKLTSNSKRLG